MKIALDVQSLLEEKKTGIGWTVQMMVENMLQAEENDYVLNYFAFRKKNKARNIINRYNNKNTYIQCCAWFPLAIYRRICRYIPIPYAFLFRHKCDITQFFNFVIPPGARGLKSVYIYDMVFKAYPETMEETTRRYMEQQMTESCNRADLIITISEFSKNEIIKYMNVNPDKIKVVPCGIDHSIYHERIASRVICEIKKKYDLNKEYFLYVGTLEPRKNIKAIIYAYRLLVQRKGDDSPNLVLAGKKGWGYEEIANLVNELQLDKKVIFTGYIEEDDKPALISGAVGFLFPSLYEGFGIPPLEAMACGTPVLVSNEASLPEVVGNAGMKVAHNDYDSMSEFMEKLFFEPGYRHKWSEEGIKQAQLFSWENSAKKLLDVYQAYQKKGKN